MPLCREIATFVEHVGFLLPGQPAGGRGMLPPGGTLKNTEMFTNFLKRFAWALTLVQLQNQLRQAHLYCQQKSHNK